MKLTNISAFKEIRVSVIFLGIYFIMLPFDFYRIESVGSVSRFLAYLPIGFTIIEQIKTYRTIKITLNSITKSGLMLFIASFLSFPLSINTDATLSALFSLGMNLLMVILFGSATVYSDKEVSFLEKSLVISGWLTAILMFCFSDLAYNRMLFQLGGKEQDPNYMCGFMMYAFCYHLNNIIQKRRIFDALISIIIVTLVFLSGSRGALLAFLIAVAASVLFSNMNNSKKGKLLGGLILISIAIYLTFRFIVPSINSSITERFTIQYLMQYGATGRTDIWKYLMEKYWNAGFFKQLFGFGYGTTYLVNDMPGVFGGHVAHNIYIEMLISAGIIGLIALIMLQVSCIRSAIKTKKSVSLCAYLGYIGMGLSLSITSYKPLWALLIILLIHMKRSRKNEVTSNNQKLV